MKGLTLENVRWALAAKLEQALDQQITDPEHPDRGALMHPAWGLAGSGNAAVLVASCILLRLASPPLADVELDAHQVPLRHARVQSGRVEEV